MVYVCFSASLLLSVGDGNRTTIRSTPWRERARGKTTTKILVPAKKWACACKNNWLSNYVVLTFFYEKLLLDCAFISICTLSTWWDFTKTPMYLRSPRKQDEVRYMCLGFSLSGIISCYFMILMSVCFGQAHAKTLQKCQICLVWSGLSRTRSSTAFEKTVDSRAFAFSGNALGLLSLGYLPRRLQT
ncbi:hypothetical protein P153DRAFT_154182 [Dothidotthia symphoricarpi CBS 119687]|uniref:Uncharacterized protein n=1 Tax=Dothidotthia symphoricarpi CBS 119687 TaxID=1392245 RepID=A0A6A6AS04_9PLEO|nr:uncharacterized protein P153DRAFT_154182 [Dothidotthia symphoricarpi CBS 119687]KAF2133311.1 hypothetical protein P153DRAFT_154182 [Dothidotthia symphoricarpi CBS 119687]